MVGKVGGKEMVGKVGGKENPDSITARFLARLTVGWKVFLCNHSLFFFYDQLPD